MYEIYARLLKEKGLKNADVSRATGIKPSVLSDWKKGRIKKLKADKLRLIADYLGVPMEFLMTGENPDYIFHYESDGEFHDILMEHFGEKTKEYIETEYYFDKLIKLPDKDRKIIEEMIERLSDGKD